MLSHLVSSTRCNSVVRDGANFIVVRSPEPKR